MNFGKLMNSAKGLIAKRGGMDSVKEDATELKDIASGKGSLGDKAKAAAAALKDPGAPGEPTTPATAESAPTPQTPTTPSN